MGGGDSTSGWTKRRRRRYSRKSQSSSLSLGAVPAFDHPPKRSKRSAPPPKPNKFVNTNIDDLPDNVLVDILSRLPNYEYVYEYSSFVCKRWRYLMSDLYYSGRYLLRHKQPPPLTLINKRGETFPIKLIPSSPKFLSMLFKRLMSVMSLTCEPVVVGASNDLILCCATESFQRDFYICNPYTIQWVNLPPPSRVLHHVPVGFICDPYYNYIKKDKDNEHRRREKSIIIDDGSEELISMNNWYRCKVVRILPYDNTSGDELSSKFKLDVYSFETCEWRESIISFPRRFRFDRINSDIHFSHNKMLYWSSIGGSSNFLIGLDPFMINDTNNNNINTKNSSISSGEDHAYHYEGRFIELIVKHPLDDPLDNPDEHNYQIHGLGVQSGGGGCLQMCVLDSFNNIILVWELKEEKDLIIAGDGAGILCSREEDIWVNTAKQVELIGFSPDIEGFLYVRLDGVDGVDGACFFEINIRTRVARKMDMAGKSVISNYCFFPIKVDPWWPTPVP